MFVVVDQITVAVQDHKTNGKTNYAVSNILILLPYCLSAIASNN
jgi:hypothetical protein